MSDDITTQTDTTQAEAGSVDATTSADEGQSAPLVDAAEDDAKKNRISQKQWKDMKEKVKQADEQAAKLKESLGLKPEDDVNVVEVLQKQISDLKSESLRKEFEAQVPKVRSEKYADAWKKIVEAKQHLIQKGELTHEDLWKMIRDEGEYKSQTEAVQETQKEEKEAFSGSVPFFGNSVSAAGSDKLSPTDKEIAKAMGWTEKTYQSAGVL